MVNNVPLIISRSAIIMNNNVYISSLNSTAAVSSFSVTVIEIFAFIVLLLICLGIILATMLLLKEMEEDLYG